MQRNLLYQLIQPCQSRSSQVYQVSTMLLCTYELAIAVNLIKYCHYYRLRMFLSQNMFAYNTCFICQSKEKYIRDGQMKCSPQHDAQLFMGQGACIYILLKDRNIYIYTHIYSDMRHVSLFYKLSLYYICYSLFIFIYIFSSFRLESSNFYLWK